MRAASASAVYLGWTCVMTVGRETPLPGAYTVSGWGVGAESIAGLDDPLQPAMESNTAREIPSRSRRTGTPPPAAPTILHLDRGARIVRSRQGVYRTTQGHENY